MGILFTLISPGGWSFFNENVVQFFQTGTDDIIKGVQAIGMQIPAPEGATPFYALDKIANFVIQPDTLIAIMGAVFAGGPYGMAMGGLLGIALYGLFKLILKAMEIYAVTFVARALVLGVAPIFFVFLLFDRTKQLFVAWLNALVNLSLQPILLFTFLSFFLVMIDTSSKTILGSELCWTQFQGVEGTGDKLSFWRFKDKDTNTAMTGDMTYAGSLECLISVKGTSKECDEFPINIVDLLSFLILVFLAERFTEIVERISTELSNALVALDTAGRLEHLVQNKNKEAGSNLPTGNVKQGATPTVNRQGG
jgi:type IV secretory pathway VirB6-like protein